MAYWAGSRRHPYHEIHMASVPKKCHLKTLSKSWRRTPNRTYCCKKRTRENFATRRSSGRRELFFFPFPPQHKKPDVAIVPQWPLQVYRIPRLAKCRVNTIQEHGFRSQPSRKPGMPSPGMPSAPRPNGPFSESLVARVSSGLAFNPKPNVP